MKNVVILSVLGMLLGIGGCRKHTGSRNFSFNFNSEKEDALTTVAKMYDSLCRELESRGFKEVKILAETRSTRYVGQYEGFPLGIRIQHLLSVSAEEPEFSYRVSFEETTEVDRLDEAAKEFRALMQEWCDHTK